MNGWIRDRAARRTSALQGEVWLFGGDLGWRLERFGPLTPFFATFASLATLSLKVDGGTPEPKE